MRRCKEEIKDVAIRKYYEFKVKLNPKIQKETRDRFTIEVLHVPHKELIIIAQYQLINH